MLLERRTSAGSACMQAGPRLFRGKAQQKRHKGDTRDTSKLERVFQLCFLVCTEWGFFSPRHMCGRCCLQRTDVLALLMRFCVQLVLETWSHDAFVSKPTSPEQSGFGGLKGRITVGTLEVDSTFCHEMLTMDKTLNLITSEERATGKSAHLSSGVLPTSDSR